MNFILKTIQGDKFVISEKEHKAIINTSKDDAVFLSSKGITLKKSMIAIIYPESQADKIEDRGNQQAGVLYDGILVKKHFGRWAYDKEKYSKNGYEIDITYPRPKDYPEIARDCVATYKQFEKIKHLSEAERLKIILGEDKPIILRKKENKLKKSGFNSLNNLLPYGKFKKSN